MRILSLAGLLSLAMIGLPPLMATTVYTTGSTPVTYNTVNANQIGPAEGFTAMAESFTPAAAAKLGRIDVPVNSISGTGNLVVEIAANGAGGVPGAIIESLNTSVSTTLSLVTLASVTHPQLNAGTKYWIIVTTNGTLNVNWFVASNLDLRGADFLNGTTWTANGGSTKGAADVLSTAPEPAGAALAAMGVALILIRSLRRP